MSVRYRRQKRSTSITDFAQKLRAIGYSTRIYVHSDSKHELHIRSMVLKMMEEHP